MGSEAHQHVGGELEQLHITNDVEHTTDTSCPKTMLSLPRELRDQIYSHLRHHEHVREKPYYTRKKADRGKFSEANERDKSSAHTYQYHTNILSVSRQIHDEAAQMLKSNQFVVVSYLWPELAIVKHKLGVPVVTENQTHVKGFKSHVLRVHLQRPPDTIGRSALKVESFLIVAPELPALCTVIRYVYSSMPSPANHVVHLSGDPPHHFDLTRAQNLNIKSVPTLKIRLEFDKVQPNATHLTSVLLEPFRKVLYRLQNVKVLNVCEGSTQYIETLTKTMVPRTVWKNALAWDIYELMRDLKQKADDLVHQCSLVQARSLYHGICLLFYSCSIFELQQHMFNNEVASIVSRLDNVIVGSAIGMNLIDIVTETFDFETATARGKLLLNVAGHTLNIPGNERGLPAAHSLLIVWNEMITRFLLYPDEHTLRNSVQHLGMLVEQSEADLQPSEVSLLECFKYDLAKIKDHLNRKELRAVYLDNTPTSLKLLCRCLSVSRLGIPIFASHTLNEKPAHIDGLVDTKHYEQMLVADPEEAGKLI